MYAGNYAVACFQKSNRKTGPDFSTFVPVLTETIGGGMSFILKLLEWDFGNLRLEFKCFIPSTLCPS